MSAQRRSTRVDRMDEDDVRVRPSKGTRPRTRNRPEYNDAISGMVTAVDRGRWTVDVDGLTVNAMRGSDARRQMIVVGDIVDLTGDVTGQTDTIARIVRVQERSTILRRTPDDNETAEKPVVANADLLMIVTAVADPEPRPRMIDRCLVAAFDGGLTPILCLTKTDLADPAALLAAYEPLGITVVTARRGAGDSMQAEQVREVVQGKISVFFGHSGVGKSTLVNELVPGSRLAVGIVNDATGKGRHTSSAVRALRLADGGWVIDTPGVRSFGLGAVSVERVVAAFPDLAAATEECLPNCTHAIGLPGCRMEQVAIASGASPERVHSLRRLLSLREEREDRGTDGRARETETSEREVT